MKVKVSTLSNKILEAIARAKPSDVEYDVDKAVNILSGAEEIEPGRDIQLITKSPLPYEDYDNYNDDYRKVAYASFNSLIKELQSRLGDRVYFSRYPIGSYGPGVLYYIITSDMEVYDLGGLSHNFSVSLSRLTPYKRDFQLKRFNKNKKFAAWKSSL